MPTTLTMIRDFIYALHHEGGAYGGVVTIRLPTWNFEHVCRELDADEHAQRHIIGEQRMRLDPIAGNAIPVRYVELGLAITVRIEEDPFPTPRVR